MVFTFHLMPTNILIGDVIITPFPIKAHLSLAQVPVMADENDDFIHEIEQLLLEDGISEEVDEKGRDEPKEDQKPPKTE